MRGIRIVIAGITALAGIVMVSHFSRAGRDWRRISTAFGGITNLPSGRFAVISVSNDGAHGVKLRYYFMIEYVGIPPGTPVAGPGGAALTNLIRLLPTGTNLAVNGSQKAELLIGIPTEGDAWIVTLEFAPTGLRTKWGEYLMRTRPQWANLLPPSLRGVPVHSVTQFFTIKGTANKTLQ